MADLIIDASALIATGFGEPEGILILERIEGHALHAPLLLQLELANATLSKIRRDPDRRDERIMQFTRLLNLPIQDHEIDPTAVLHLALDTGLTTYDAAYLWLAESLECELATLDHQIEAVATSRR